VILPLLCVAEGKGDDDGPQKTYEFISPSIGGVEEESQTDIDRCEGHKEQDRHSVHEHQDLIQSVVEFFEVDHVRSAPPSIRRGLGISQTPFGLLLILFFVFFLQGIHILNDLITRQTRGGDSFDVLINEGLDQFWDLCFFSSRNFKDLKVIFLL